MQSRKSDADVESICEICPSLTGAQILKLIKSYTLDDCEDPITHTFIEKLSSKLSEIKRNVVSIFRLSFGILFAEQIFNFIFSSPHQSIHESFTMDENHIKNLSVVFQYNEIKLEDIEIPDVLRINDLVTKI